MQGLPELDIPLEQHNTLRLKKGAAVNTGEGSGYLLSMGTLISSAANRYEFCMTFVVVDKRTESGWRLDVLVFPVSTRDDLNGVEEHSVLFEEGKVKTVIANFQREQINKAYSWLSELKTAGYLARPRKTK